MHIYSSVYITGDDKYNDIVSNQNNSGLKNNIHFDVTHYINLNQEKWPKSYQDVRITFISNDLVQSEQYILIQCAITKVKDDCRYSKKEYGRKTFFSLHKIDEGKENQFMQGLSSWWFWFFDNEKLT